MESFSCKYGKPSEFLLAWHLSTQAPDMVYKLATSSSTDTKVYIDMWPKTEQYYPVLEDQKDETLESVVMTKIETMFEDIKTKFKTCKEDIINHLKNENYDDYFEAARKKRYDECYQEHYNQCFNDYYNQFYEEELQNRSGLLKEVQAAFAATNRVKIEAERLANEDAEETAEKKAEERINEAYDIILSEAEAAEDIEEFSYIVLQYIPEDVIGGNPLDWKIATICEQECSYNDITSLLTEIEKLTKTMNNATPYITKVVNHWYRNQYFVEQGNEVENAKKVANGFIETLRISAKNNLIKEMGITDLDNLDEEQIKKFSEIDKLLNIYIEEINAAEEIKNLESVEYEEITLTIQDFSQTGEVTERIVDIKVRKDVIALFKIMDRAYESFNFDIQNKLKNNLNLTKYNMAMNYGTTYELSEIPPQWIEITDYSDSENETVNNIINSSYEKVESTPDIVQIHNPTFEDNSQFIRRILQDKYIIYDGTDRNKEEQIQAKSYIQGRSALENIVEMLRKSTTAEKYAKYLERDVVEFMEDYSFELDQIQEINAQKDLKNIMPAYKPYRAWPSEYEKADSIWTKMIYKTETSAISEFIAPANCIITRKGNVIEFGILDENDSICEYLYVTTDKDENGNNYANFSFFNNVISDSSNSVKVSKGTQIGSISHGINEKMIIIKVMMMDVTRQKIDVTTRLDVPKRNVDVDTNSIDIIIQNLMSIVTYPGNAKKDMYKQECLAILCTALNRIESPYCKDDISFSSLNWKELGIAERNKSKTTTVKNNLKEGKTSGEQAARELVQLALNGADPTKESTLIGATRYFDIEKAKKEIKNNLNDNKEYSFEELLLNTPLKQEISTGGYYISNEEYDKYQQYYINEKIRNVFMQFNSEKSYINKEKGYTSGYGQYKISQTENVEENLSNVINKIKESVHNLADDKCIISIVTTDISEKIEADEETFTDTFNLKVNSNRSSTIMIQYKCTEQGNIDYSTLTYSEVENSRL